MQRTLVAVLSGLALAGCAQQQPSEGTVGAVEAAVEGSSVGAHGKHFNQDLHRHEQDKRRHRHDDDDDDGAVSGQAGPAGTTGYGITYHGGAVLHGTVNAYYIWYGNWAGNSATTILTDLINNFGGSPYYNINTTYGDSSGQSVANSVQYAGAENDNYSRGTSLSDADIQTIVASHIGAGHFPLDTNGIYFVLTSSDVNATSGFCSQYCGWHTHGTIGGADIKYSFVGNADRCLSACAAQSTGPNGNAGADGMASIIAHEFEETASDPDLNAWYDSSGAENADKCAWTFGTQYTVGNGAKANMHLGTRDFLIQQNWRNTAPSGGCALSYGSCTPSCGGNTCGTDGCGGSCGTCGAGAVCNAGSCCTLATCGAATCGSLSDGCGGTLKCGTCTAPQTCGGGGVAHQCGCTANCAGKSCGTDGCGGSCGSCGGGAVCNAGSCCTPVTSCGSATCGSIANGCGGTLSCGSCPGGQVCNGSNVCVTQTNPVVNGGFESAFASWTRAGTTSISATSHSGASSAMLGSTSPTNGNSSASQTFTVPASGVTTLTFYYKMTCPDSVRYDWATATVKDNVTGKTVTVLAKTCAINSSWVQVNASVTANLGHSVTLTLTSRDDNYPGDASFTLYDDVSVH